ncbi:MAG: ASCH domain-containing protein [Solirubrobacteraceae bacterium]
MEFSRELRNDVLAGDITLSVRLWKRPQVKQGGRYRVGPGEIEIDAIELVPFAAITGRDIRRAGEPDREPRTPDRSTTTRSSIELSFTL